MKQPPIIAIQGGLGNQLFQWFYAHQLSNTGEFRIYPNFPVGSFPYVVRELELAPMIPRCPHFQKTKELNGYLSAEAFVPRIFDRLWNYSRLSSALHLFGYYREDPRTDTRAHSSKPGRIRYASGYFQNWEFPNRQLESVKVELLPILDELFSNLSAKFDLVNPYKVIHVRRWETHAGQDPKTTMGSLKDEFFTKWVSAHPSERLIILTEKRSEIEDLIALTNPDLVLDQSDASAWETLAIMSKASLFLGSNSSLSWWGAWTANLNGASTFLPSEWDSTIGRFNTSDFIYNNCQTVTSVWEMPFTVHEEDI